MKLTISFYYLALQETVEDMQLSPGLSENKQVAKRKFFHLENKIFLTFHNAPDQISAGYLHFIKPSEEISKFGVEHEHEYEVRYTAKNIII
jgi:hypothetical protein